MDLIKSQIITMSAMQGAKDGSGIINAVYGIILISLIEQLFKYLPLIGAFIKKYSEVYIKRRYSSMSIMNTLSASKKELTGSIILERSYLEKDANQNGELVEALLEYVAKLPNIKFLKYRTRFFVSHKEEFQIDKEIYGKCLECSQNGETGELEKLTIQVYSYTLDIQELRAYLNKVHKNYIAVKKNQLGDQTYFFDHITSQLNTNLPLLRFDMTPFNTNKSLRTIYGSYMANVVKRINFFIKNRDWYIKKGIPHTLGLLLHGPPGCGKTSLIKAVANDTHRHIINIQLTKNVTQTQLKSLFFNEEICIFNKKTGQNELYIIPLEQRIYVMEDVDAVSDILYSRDIIDEKKEVEDMVRTEAYEVAKKAAIAKGYDPPPPPSDNTIKESLTLAFVLNLLDGILETPGRIIILTSNHPEKLDSALVRPGRIDLNIHFDRCSRETIVELVTKFYETIDETSAEWCKFLSELRVLDEYMLTPAEVNKTIFNYYNEPEKGFSEILREIREKSDTCRTETFPGVKEQVNDIQNTNTLSDIPIKEVDEIVSNNKAIKEVEEVLSTNTDSDTHIKEVEIGKFYLITREHVQNRAISEGLHKLVRELEDKMYIVNDTVLITSEQFNKTLKIYSNETNIVSKHNKCFVMITNYILNNRKILLKSKYTDYTINTDDNGVFIYVNHTDLMDASFIVDIQSTINIRTDNNLLKQNTVTERYEKQKQMREDLSNILSFDTGTSNFSLISDNPSDNSSLLDEQFKLITS
jgi:DNA polymerase III delta prime subunit